MGLRVLHLIDSGGLYGAERMLLALAEEQIKQGLEPTILSAGDPETVEKPLEREARRIGVSVLPWRMKPGLNLSEAYRILRWAKRHRIQVLHSHGYKFNILLGVWPKSQFKGAARVCTCHGYTAPMLAPTFNLRRSVDQFLVRTRYYAASLVPTDSDACLNSKKNKVFIPNPLPGDLYQEDEGWAERRGPSTSPFKLVALARLSAEKGVEELLTALGRLHRSGVAVRLDLYGEGELGQDFRRWIDSQGLAEVVNMKGFTDHPVAAMKSADAYILPSRSERMPMTVLEAMFLGLPIIATRVGAIEYMLEGYEPSYMAEPGNSHGLEKSILDALNGPKYAPSDVVRQCLTKFAPPRVCCEYTQLYERALFS
ncbi:glycosyltransferase [Aquisalimonas sp. 2447]|uniref:glycosyltransferase n=1 Tax=Aquisalimonas sp. 2447 TaxID=2740807 RepID=UPI0014327311|nr:glycosyltransferase [Aquisalimonas sp. 2447]QIT56570.1 glycosyltransferase [Aquisalimonas sp. 2447]